MQNWAEREQSKNTTIAFEASKYSTNEFTRLVCIYAINAITLYEMKNRLLVNHVRPADNNKGIFNLKNLRTFYNYVLRK